MNSRIPQPSARKPATSGTTGGLQSRIQPPSTLKKPLFQFRNAAVSTSKNIRPSAQKRPAESTLPYQSAFKRVTPLSLMRSRYAVNRPTEQPSKQLATARLEFHENPSLQNVPLIAFENDSNVGIPNSVIENLPPRIQVESRSTSPIVSWKLQDTEISSYKCKISILEKQVNEMIAKNSRSKIDNELKETKIKSELDANQRIISDLKKELTTSKDQREKLKSELEQYQNEHLKQSDAFEKAQQEYQKTIDELKEENLQIKSALAEAKSVYVSENAELKFRVNELQNLLERSNAEKQVYFGSLNELKSKDNHSEKLDFANQEIQRLSQKVESLQENARLLEIFNGEINHYQQVKEENSQLKNKLEMLSEINTKNLILKEKVENLNKQIETQNELINQKNVDLGELSFNKKRINEWIQIVGADTPDVVIGQMNEMKQTIELLRIENESLKADLKNKTSNESVVTNSSKSYEMQVNQLNKEIFQLNANLKKVNRKCMLFEKERDSYKKVLDAHESELTINFEDVQRKRISELECVISEQKALMAIYENDLRKANDAFSQLTAKEKEVHELSSEIERIKMLNPHVCTNITLDVSTLQTREKNFRVIHLKENPITVKINEYNEEFNRLSEENTRLKCLVEVLESGNVADMTRQINEGLQHRTNVEKLKKKYESLEARHDGLKSSFKKISKSFRETCLYLTGYRIDNIANNRYKLTHIYDRQKRSLIFEVNGSQQINLMEEESSLESLQDKIQTYLKEGHSYPAFLAAFSLDLFEKSTDLSRSTMWT